MSSVGFFFNHCLYFKRSKDNSIIVYLLLSVDDMLLIRQNISDINDIKRSLGSEFEIKDSSHVKRILGTTIFHHLSMWKKYCLNLLCIDQI